MNRAIVAQLSWAILVTITQFVIGVPAHGQSVGTGRVPSPDPYFEHSAPSPADGPAVRYRAGESWNPACGGNCAPGGPPIGIHEPPPFEGELSGELSGGECLDGFCGDPCGRRYSVGVEFTFVKPHFDGNPAFTLLESDGATSDVFTERELNFGTELAPRIWLEMLQCGNLGLRASWWQFDNSSGRLSGSPPANGFGQIIPPDFGNVDLSTSVPDSTYTAAANLKAYNVDLEGTHSFHCGDWGWMGTAGLRYASIEQSYDSTLTNETGATQGTIDYFQEVRGIGPTMSLRTQRPLTAQLALFGTARGSLLFGDSTSRLNAIEDQDLDTPLTTQSSTSRDGLLPVGDVQVGLQYAPICSGCWQPYLHFAMEGQVWGGAGNSSSQTGTLGFYGFNFALGCDW